MQDPNYDLAQAKLILMSAISGILLTYVFIALEYLFGVKTAPTFRLMIQIFGALALVLGETFLYIIKYHGGIHSYTSQVEYYSHLLVRIY